VRFVARDRIGDVNDYVRSTCPSCGWIYYPSTGILPGGIVEYGETLEQCVIHEPKEETGLEITDLTQICRFLSQRSLWADAPLRFPSRG